MMAMPVVLYPCSSRFLGRLRPGCVCTNRELGGWRMTIFLGGLRQWSENECLAMLHEHCAMAMPQLGGVRPHEQCALAMPRANLRDQGCALMRERGCENSHDRAMKMWSSNAKQTVSPHLFCAPPPPPPPPPQGPQVCRTWGEPDGVANLLKWTAAAGQLGC
jgi:hypothetical protein